MTRKRVESGLFPLPHCLHLPRMNSSCRVRLSRAPCGRTYGSFISHRCSLHHFPLGGTLLKTLKLLPSLLSSRCSPGLSAAAIGGDLGLSSHPSWGAAVHILLLPYLCGRGTSGVLSRDKRFPWELCASSTLSSPILGERGGQDLAYLSQEIGHILSPSPSIWQNYFQ